VRLFYTTPDAFLEVPKNGMCELFSDSLDLQFQEKKGQFETTLENKKRFSFLLVCLTNTQKVFLSSFSKQNQGFNF
jgi:hypothetical protein